MTRLILDKTIQPQTTVTLTGEKTHYLSTVIRCRVDEIIIVTDSTGTAYSGRISAITKKQTTIEIAGPFDQNNESSLDIILLQGLLKGEKMDLVIQKATELGVAEIVPVITERSQLRTTRKLQRWQKIAEEASRQSGRNRIPLIHEPEAFETAIVSQGLNKGIIFWEEKGAPFSAAVAELKNENRIVLCIGPEGGFSAQEVRAASQNSFVVTSMGKRILRAETAAISAVAIVQYSLGDISAVP